MLDVRRYTYTDGKQFLVAVDPSWDALDLQQTLQDISLQYGSEPVDYVDEGRVSPDRWAFGHWVLAEDALGWRPPGARRPASRAKKR